MENYFAKISLKSSGGQWVNIELRVELVQPLHCLFKADNVGFMLYSIQDC